MFALRRPARVSSEHPADRLGMPAPGRDACFAQKEPPPEASRRPPRLGRKHTSDPAGGHASLRGEAIVRRRTPAA
jgi:hypothetical protein